MGHGLTDNDRMFSVRRPPWHGLGAVLENYPRSIDEALDQSGLGWGVTTGRVLVERRARWRDDFGRERPAELELAESYKATLRSDTGELLGIVGADYEPLDNREAFRFLDELIGSQLHFETAGSLFGGRRVWVLARLPEWVEVGGDRAGTYVYVANAHDGSMAVTAAVTPVRIVCANTLGSALSRAEGVHAPRTFRFRHTTGLHTRLRLHEARRVMQITIDYAEQFKRLGDRLALEPITERTLRTRVLDRLFAVPEGRGGRAARNREEAKQAVMAIFRGQGAAGDTRGSAPGSKWCAANAIAEYADFGRRYTRRSNQVQRSFEDTQLKQRGLKPLLEA
jgi:phage/plasmid-like protein (TIGR03299 family)